MSVWHHEKVCHVTGELNSSQVSVGGGLVEVDRGTWLVDVEQLSISTIAESHARATFYDLTVLDPASDEVESPEFVMADPAQYRIGFLTTRGHDEGRQRFVRAQRVKINFANGRPSGRHGHCHVKDLSTTQRYMHLSQNAPSA